VGQVRARERSAKKCEGPLTNYCSYRYIDPDSSHPYYFCEATQESTYERPEGFATVADPFASARKVMEPAKVLTARRDEGQKPVENLNNGWVKYVDPESGHPYYWNEQKDESSYERPEGFATVADPFASARKVMEPAKVLTARRGEGQKPVENLNDGWVT
jgi:hypothetical protein